MLTGKGHVREHILFRLYKHLGRLGPARLEGLDDLLQLLPSRLAVRPREDGPHRCSDHRFVPLGHMSKQVPQAMDPTPLPRRATEHFANGGFQALVLYLACFMPSSTEAT